MKKIINIKSILVYSIAIAGTLFLASSCTNNKNNDSKNVTQQENIAEQENIGRLSVDDKIVVIKNDNDAKFLMRAAELQLENISLGNLAQEKGSSSHVKELGKMMVTDHTKSLTELKALALSKSVSIPTTITNDSQDSSNKLGEKTGNDFEKAYSDKIVENHEDAIELYEKASNDSEDPKIRTWASNQLPTLRMHLEQAKASKVINYNTTSL